MAGAGYKLFTTGSVLTASDVNTYLNEQTVMVFASATARTTALSGVLAEGMVSYLKDTNATEVYDGSAWVAIGSSGDITGVTAGTGISGGGTSGTVTITNAMATEITAAGDIIVGTGSGTFDNLPIGTTGQVLTADTTVSPYKVKWATAAAGGGAYTSIASGSLSGTTVSITSISGSYTDLYLIVNDLNLASANYISFRFNNDTTALYHQQLQFAGRIGGGLQSASDSGTTVGPAYWYPASGDNNHSFYMRVNNYTSSFTKTGTAGGYFKSDNGNWGIVGNTIGYQGTSAITQIDILTGATMNGGTYTLYGVK